MSSNIESIATLSFIKAHGTENDFVVVVDTDDELEQRGVLTRDLVAALCDRHAGIGADGFLRVVRTESGWFMDYRNADGSIAELCGNGIRVFVHVLAALGLEGRTDFNVDTRAGVKHVTVHEVSPSRAVIEVDMGRVEVTGVSTARMGEFSFAGLGIDVGNPHLACVIPGMTPEQLADLHFTPPVFDTTFFPDGVNVEILTEMHEGEATMRVWERGVGETRSCGTGTVAAARAAFADAGVENGTVKVHVPGGAVTVQITDGSATITGPSVIVARGEVQLTSVAGSAPGIGPGTS